MAQSITLTLNENNDEEILAVLTTNKPTAGTLLNLTGKTLEAYLKVSPATSDVDGSTWKGTIANGGVVVTGASVGELSVMVPAASVTTAMKWFRLDVLDSGLRKTALYGVVTVVDL